MAAYPRKSHAAAAAIREPFAAPPRVRPRLVPAPQPSPPEPARASGGAVLTVTALYIFAVWMVIETSPIVVGIAHHREGSWLAAATALAILLSALASSVAGFAFSAIAGSALAHLKIDPVQAVQIMVMCSIAIQLYAVWTIRESIRWRPLLPVIAAGAATVPVGVWLLLHVHPLAYGAGLGVFLTAYGCIVAIRRDSIVLHGKTWHGAAAGALGGLAGGLAGIPGAFVTIWCSMRGWDKLQQRAVYQPYILAMQIVAIVCLHWQSHSHLDLEHDASFVPFALLGAIGGLAVFRRMSNKQFQLAVSVLLVISGMGLLARVL